MKTSTWKNVEMNIARYLGGARVPVTGRTRGSAPDIDRHAENLLTAGNTAIYESFMEGLDTYMREALIKGIAYDKFSFEIKHRSSMPEWLCSVHYNLRNQESLVYLDVFSKKGTAKVCNLEAFRQLIFIEQADNHMNFYTKSVFPDYVLDGRKQAIASKTLTEQVPVVVVHKKQWEIKDSLVFIFYN